MNTQNIDPQKDNANQEPSTGNLAKTGLDEWNERLDHNLEPEAEGDTIADENAADYSEEKGSGDQSDEN